MADETASVSAPRYLEKALWKGMEELLMICHLDL
jgi:hypothetical protein